MGAIAFPFTIAASGGVAFVNDDSREAINEIVNCLTTGANERLLRPGYGAGVRDYVFEPLDDLTITEIQGRVQRAIQRDVPSVSLRDVRVSQDESRIIVSVFFALSAEIDGRVYVATVAEGVTTEESF